LVAGRLDPFTSKQLNMLGTVPKQVCNFRFCGALKCCLLVKGLMGLSVNITVRKCLWSLGIRWKCDLDRNLFQSWTASCISWWNHIDGRIWLVYLCYVVCGWMYSYVISLAIGCMFILYRLPVATNTMAYDVEHCYWWISFDSKLVADQIIYLFVIPETLLYKRS